MSCLLVLRLIASEPVEQLERARYVGPRSEVISPFSTNACEIFENAGIPGVRRIERFSRLADDLPPSYDRMTQEVYRSLNESSLQSAGSAEPLRFISDIAAYNQEAGLALSDDEVSYLQETARELGRELTDAEVYGFRRSTPSIVATRFSTAALLSTVKKKKNHSLP